MQVRNISNQRHDLQRRDRLIQERGHDHCQAKMKLREPTVCEGCGAVFHKGRWSWGEALPGAEKALCPACMRRRDRMPAAHLTLRGTFPADHRQEVMQLARHHEERERAEHPLMRIMAVEESTGEIRLSFTDAHLARGIGEALRDVLVSSNRP